MAFFTPEATPNSSTQSSRQGSPTLSSVQLMQPAATSSRQSTQSTEGTAPTPNSSQTSLSRPVFKLYAPGQQQYATPSADYSLGSYTLKGPSPKKN